MKKARKEELKKEIKTKLEQGAILDDITGLTFEEAEYANNYLHSQGVDSFIEVYSDTLYSVEWSKE
jgi:hypothetical protein